MQNERGTPRTLQHRLTCEDVISRSLPALCTTWLTSGAVRDRGGVFCLFWCLQTARYLHINMAFCTSGLALFEPMQKRRGRFKKFLKRMMRLFPLLRETFCFSLKPRPVLWMIQGRLQSRWVRVQLVFRQRGRERLRCINIRAYLCPPLCVFSVSNRRCVTCEQQSVRKRMRSPRLPSSL